MVGELAGFPDRVPDVKGAPGLVLVLVPYTFEGGELRSVEYDYPAFRAELATWFARPFRWVPVSLHGPAESRIDRVLEEAARIPDVVLFNLCDGAEVDGVPGRSIVQALAASGLPFTGADEHFYATTESKTRSKRCFERAGVPTSPWQSLEGPGDLERAAALGFPLFLKPDVTAASVGVSLRSRVDSTAALAAELERMRSVPVAQAGLFVERFLPGREYTVLLVEDRDAPDGVYSLPAGERVFDPALPKHEHFLSRERYTEVFVDEAPGPGLYCNIERVPAALEAPLRELAIRAFRAVSGTSYARVDIRADDSGKLHVLEVNSNCGLSGDPESYTGQLICMDSGGIQGLVTRILAHARRRG